ncbi:uncharacterized protein LOC131946351 [Physella acuta]|uniref:uncharacterized protein LOC131946351 n=1 Tax=Physella acuta TaxID=109671 RepID=UPI0027DBA483|nr:uncharacterized protein LOC131946351 [Physella acuta]
MEGFNKTESWGITEFYYHLCFSLVLVSGLAFFGVVSNVINQVVFIRLGLQERVNLTLYCLSVSDFFNSVKMVSHNSTRTYNLPIYDIDDPACFYFFWTLLLTSCVLAVFCTLANLLNMTIFVLHGLHERVNFSLFFLSTSDCLQAITCLATTTSYYTCIYPPSDDVNWVSILTFFFWTRCLFADVSSGLILFITIERCLCVVIPFSFNASCTFKKTRFVVYFIISFVVINYLPFLGSMKYVYRIFPERNGTVLTAEYPDPFSIMCAINSYMFGVVLAIVCQVCIFVCAVLMYRGLRKSTEIRDHTREFQVSESQTGKLARDKSPGLTKKEKRVVKLVMMLAITYLPTGVPQILFVFTFGYVPDGWFHPSATAILFLVTANGSLSIFIYYNFSSSYRQTFLFLCRRSQPVKK